ncbi:MAG TPA: hypothetical protein VGF55_21910 [Gemmataceae bacterium]|jgi:hypothetical protein
MRRKSWFLGGLALVAGLGLWGVARAWWVNGHATITEAAANALPDDVPAFFRAAGKTLAHCAGDPDRWKNREAKFLKSAVYPEHFIDWEDLEGNEPPADRYVFLALAQKLQKAPDKIGTLPWAIMEGYERVMLAFADYRKDPNNPAIPMKCIVYAGNVAHYTTDASMPLHTTRDYDGRRGPDGRMKQKGIHAKLDGFPEKFGFTPEEVSRGLQAKAVDDVWDYVLKFLKESRTHIDKAYELDAAGGFDKPTDESRAFVMARCRAGAQFTMDLWYTAWVKSAKVPASY